MAPHTPTANTLFYGDNLAILREQIADETVDLVYLDPPFNSNATYNVLFKSPTGEQSPAQMEAFGDTWHWDISAERAFDEVVQSGNSDAAELIMALRKFLGTNDMMAYLAMMAVRLIELQRVLKPTGSLYLHCDPTASHYLRIVLDAIFGPKSYLNEIIWRRTGAHNNARRYGPIHDVIHFVSKSDQYKHQPVFRPYTRGHVDSYFTRKDHRGRYWTNSVHGKGIRHGESGEAWRGYDVTSKGRHWAIPRDLVLAFGIDPNLKSLAKLDALDSFGLLDLPNHSSGALPTYRQYLDSSPGILLQDIWSYQPHTKGMLYNSNEAIDEDVRWLVAQGDSDRLGYETQKPSGLLERIISASSNPGDLVLDPFCGCGTTVHAAQKLGRRWIGIDITHLAVGLITRRLTEAFPLATFTVLGTPKDIGAAQALSDADKHQFQLWVLSLIDNAQPYKGGKKGSDGGVDGYVYFKADKAVTEKAIVSVKGGAHVSDTMVKDLITTVEHEGAKMGLFLTLAPPTKNMRARAAAAGFYETEWRKYPRIQILTVEELLEGKRPEMPWLDPSAFKKAKVEKTDTQGALL